MMQQLALCTHTGYPNCTHNFFFNTHLFILLLVLLNCFNGILCIVFFHFFQLYFMDIYGLFVLNKCFILTPNGTLRWVCGPRRPHREVCVCYCWNYSFLQQTSQQRDNKKVSSYIAQYLVLRIAQSTFTLYFPGRPVQSNTVSTSLGSIQPYATIN